LRQLLFFLAIVIGGCVQPRQKDKAVKPALSPEFTKGDSFYRVGNDLAFYYFNQVVQKYPNSQEIATAYNYMALIQRRKGDYFGSQESLLESLKHTKKENHYAFYWIYTMLGNNYESLKNYDAAISYYNLAVKDTTADTQKIYPLNAIAVVYQKKREYPQAIKIYRSIIAASVTDKKEYSRILSNFARAKWQQDPSYNPLPEFYAALNIRRDEKDSGGLNASYSHLSDYYDSIARPDSALYYAEKMYEIAKLNNSPDDQLEALQKLIDLGPAKNLRYYATTYRLLNDSVQTVRNNAKNQFAVIRYEAEKSKADNLILQAQIFKQRVLLYLAIFGILLIIIISTILHRKRKQRIELKAQHAIQENQLKTSQKVHDVVANGLYRIMLELEHNPNMDKKQLEDKINVLYERSRGILHEPLESIAHGYQETIAELLKPFANATTKILIAGNQNGLWDQVNANIKNQLEPILQELMVNMKKHSHAKKVIVNFKKEDDQLVVLYQDDGVGLTPSFQYGNGLKNTENRIREAGGQLIFENAPLNGLKIRICFPLS